jgi:2-hydroxychromene-2-carboxylate isomerase
VPRVEFFFDLSSPWTYLAFINVQQVLKRTGADIRYRPILVGGVFNAINPAVYAARENPDTARMRHTSRMLHAWAAWSGVTLKFPSPHHPVKSVHAMRMACALEDDQVALERFARAAFESYFLRALNIDEPDVLVATARSVGLDGVALRAASQSDAIKARLRANTDELIARGGYGSPTLFVDRDAMYFGNDQLPLVEFALQGTPAT